MKSIFNLAATYVDMTSEITKAVGKIVVRSTAGIFDGIADVVDEAASAVKRSRLPEALRNYQSAQAEVLAETVKHTPELTAAQGRVDVAIRRFKSAWREAEQTDASNAA